MTSSTASTATPLQHAFERRVDEVKPSKSDINALILDYLTAEGYPSAAARFSKEANLKPLEDEESVRQRNQIKHDIHLGSIQDAIEALNELNPQILDSSPELHFSLLRLQLVELIRTCNNNGGTDIQPALTFATTQLAPRAPTNPKFLDDLERTMALLLFPPDNLEPQIAAILHPDLRKKVADEVNKAILISQGQKRNADIRSLVRLRAWAEDTARESKKDLPAQLNVGLDAHKMNVDLQKENGHDFMMTGP